MKKILFICEGKTAEPKFIDVLKKYFLSNDDDNFEVYSYCQNIYDLYNTIKDDLYLDICGILKEKAKTNNDDEGYGILNNSFAEIYLFFDFEMQDTNFDVNKIKEMQEFFNDETYNGKLYINYPMFESFCHFESLPDKQYLNYDVDMETCKHDGYKRLIGSLLNKTKFSLQKMSYSQYGMIVNQNINKYSKIVNKPIFDYSDYKKYFSLDSLLESQIEYYNEKNKVFVINTSVLWPLNYFKKERAEKLYRNFSK